MMTNYRYNYIACLLWCILLQGAQTVPLALMLLAFCVAHAGAALYSVLNKEQK